jgi:hypothetical protein
VELHAHLSRDIADTQVVELLRSLRFPPLRALQAVDLEGSLVGAKGLSHLCSAVLRKNSLPNLKQLNLNRNSAQAIGVSCLYQALCAVDCCPLLERLSLAANRAEGAVLDFLCGQVLRSRPALTFLDLSDNNVCLAEGDASLTLRSNAPRLDTLHSLDLSFNPLEDAGMHTLLSCAWPLPALTATSKNCLRHLILVNCNIGNKTFAYIGDLLQTSHFRLLETLSLGMNQGRGGAGLSGILEALCPLEARIEQRPPPPNTTADTATADTTMAASSGAAPVLALKHLLLNFNNFNNEGLLAVMNAAMLGAIAGLETLDVSDVGASTDTIHLFLRNVTQHARCDCLKKLVVFGRHPFAQRAIRSSHFPETFLRRVKVS